MRMVREAVGVTVDLVARRRSADEADVASTLEVNAEMRAAVGRERHLGAAAEVHPSQQRGPTLRVDELGRAGGVSMRHGLSVARPPIL
jgi:hypothetical protein